MTITLEFTLSPGFAGVSCAKCEKAAAMVRCEAVLNPGVVKFYLCDDCAEALREV